jgi:hypothetical protein
MQDSPISPAAAIAQAIEGLSPATMSYEAFCQEAVARVEEVGPDLVCVPSASHWPERLGNGRPARTEYSIQVWSSPDGGRSLGTHAFSVGGNSASAEKCLTELGRELAGLKAKREYDASRPK